MKKILITGAGGFIGKNLCYGLSDTKNEITAFSKSKIEFGYGFNHVKGDMKNTKLISNLVDDLDVIIHLAADTHAMLSFQRLDKIFQSNIKGTFNLLKSIASFKKKPHFIFLSSNLVYGNEKKIPIKETESLEPYSPYAMTKSCGEFMCRGFANSYNIPLTILRPFFTYGKYVPHHTFFPRIIKQIENNSTVILDNPNEIRDCVFVDDVVDAIKKAIKSKPSKIKVYNIGSGKKISVIELVEKIIKFYPKKITVKKGRKTELNNRKLVADINLIKKELNWSPKTSLHDGLEKTIALTKSKSIF